MLIINIFYKTWPKIIEDGKSEFDVIFYFLLLVLFAKWSRNSTSTRKSWASPQTSVTCTLTEQSFRKHLYAFLFGENHQYHPSLNQGILTNFNSQQRSKSSFITTSFVNTTTHRPLITTQSQSNDPSQRLLSDSKYMMDWD